MKHSSTTANTKTAENAPAPKPIGHCHVDRLFIHTSRTRCITINADASRCDALGLLSSAARHHVPVIVFWRGPKSRAKAEAIVAWVRSLPSEGIAARFDRLYFAELDAQANAA